VNLISLTDASVDGHHCPTVYEVYSLEQ